MTLRFALLLTLLPAIAFARPPEGSAGTTFGENPSRDYQSPQWFNLEFKFTPYSPRIDSSEGLNGAKPFSELFNKRANVGKQPGKRLLSQAELDVQFFHKHGSLAIGALVGYAYRSTHSLAYADPSTSPPTPCTFTDTENPCVRTGDKTTLNVMPFALLLVYRWDYLAQRYHVPLVPYAKVGIAYYLWWITNGSGAIASYSPSADKKDTAIGGTFGFLLNPGIAFQLDVIDPSAARTMDAEIGINHTYLFCELQYANIDGFGAKGKLDLSDTTLNAGISFEF